MPTHTANTPRHTENPRSAADGNETATPPGDTMKSLRRDPVTGEPVQEAVAGRTLPHVLRQISQGLLALPDGQHLRTLRVVHAKIYGLGHLLFLCLVGKFASRHRRLAKNRLNKRAHLSITHAPVEGIQEDPGLAAHRF